MPTGADTCPAPEGTVAYSVLMSVYGREKAAYLETSVQSMLHQTVPPSNFVLVCDGALTAELDAVIDSFSKRYPQLFQIVRLAENQGLGKALNAGLAVCRYDLVARMDSDDVSAPQRCALQLAAFAREPALAMVGGAVSEFEKDPTCPVAVKKMPESHEEILRYAKLRNPFNHPSVMYRRSAVLRAGGYRDAPLHEDYDLWVRMLMNGARTCNLPQVLCNMRVDEGMYERRGGLRYLRLLSGFHRKLYRMGFCSLGQYVTSVAVYAVSCLAPASVRRRLYQKILRKQ